MDAARSYWPIGYDDLGSYYDKFEGVSGAWSKAGKLQDKKIVGGNIFETPRSSEFPHPPLTPVHNMESFEKAARDLGYQSFSVPDPVPRVPMSIRTASRWAMSLPASAELHSKIGKRFDLKRNTGVVGRSYAYQSRRDSN